MQPWQFRERAYTTVYIPRLLLHHMIVRCMIMIIAIIIPHGMYDLYVWCVDIDECSEGNHDCINASGCVDTEGGHYCLTSTTMEPTSTPSTMVTPSSTTSGTTPDLEPTTETDITVTLSAGPSSTTVTSDTFTMSLSATSASHGIETTGSISSINTLSATTTYGNG